MKFLALCLLLGTLASVHGYKILAFFPFPVKSHHRTWDPLLKELALRGHEVTAVKPFKMADPPNKNYHEIQIEDIYPAIMKNFNVEKSFTRMSETTKQTLTLTFMGSGLSMGEVWLKDPGVQQILNSNETYDAVLFETTFMQPMFTALQHKFNAVGIEVQTFGNFHWGYWLFGNPTDTSYIPDWNLAYSSRMTFLQRLHNTFSSLVLRIFWYNNYMPKYQAFMDKYIKYPGSEERPSMIDMIANTSLVLVNTDDALTYPHPKSPHFIQVGGINVLPNKPLPKDLQEFMDGADNGVIYFTLGSQIKVSSVLGSSLRDIFAKVFSKLKERVLWKWETEDFPNPPPNVRISQWFPQQGVLAHENMKMFITQGGFLSVTESIHFGVPMVGIPIFGDQDKNVAFIENKGLGVYLEFFNLTEESVTWAVEEVLESPKYLENVRKQSKLLRDKPITPLENAIFWTEYVIRHKGAHHLKPMLATMPWYQSALIDVYITLALIILAPVYFVYLLFYYTCKRIFRGNKQKKKKE